MPKASNELRDSQTQQADFLRLISFDKQLLTIFEIFEDVHYFVKNRAGETLFVTKAWALRHGFENPEQMVLKTDLDLTPGVLAEGYLADDAVVYETGAPLLGKVEICLDEVGLPDWYITHKFPLRDRKGTVIGLIGVSIASQGKAPKDSPSERISRATKLLREELREFPGSEKLAKRCSLSVRHLQRCFEETLRISPHEYWMKCRIRMACELLRSGQVSLVEVAQELGFCDQSSFTAQFRKHTGMTPNTFRLRNTRQNSEALHGIT